MRATMVTDVMCDACHVTTTRVITRATQRRATRSAWRVSGRTVLACSIGKRNSETFSLMATETTVHRICDRNVLLCEEKVLFLSLKTAQIKFQDVVK